MTQIAICDDELPFTGILERMLLEQQSYYGNFNIDVYSSGEELIADLERNEYFDIVFLDIEMGKLNGVEVGHYIRKVRDNPDTVIIYVSSHEQYHLELYPVQPIAFIRKPPQSESVRQALDSAFAKINSSKSKFSYHVGFKIINVRKADIYYFESNGKKVRIVGRLIDDSFTMSLDKLAMLDDDKDFILTHRAFIANLRNVTTFTRTELFFPNGDSIPISTKKGYVVKTALIKHINQNQFPSNIRRVT